MVHQKILDKMPALYKTDTISKDRQKLVKIA